MIKINIAFNSAKLFGLFTIFYAIITNINLYQANKYVNPTFKEIAKFNFYLLGVFWLINILVGMSFSIGVNKYNIPVWIVNIIYWGAAVIPTVVMTYLWFGQLPNLTQLIGILLVLSGIILVVIK